MQLLRALLNFARVEPNPTKGVRLYREHSRERYLSGEELRRLFLALDAAPNETIADAIRMALLTGARRNNVCTMEWAELDLDRGLWTIPAAKFKTGRPLVVPLMPDAVVLLRRRLEGQRLWLASRKEREGLEAMEECRYVFPGRTPDHPLREVKSTWDAVEKPPGWRTYIFTTCGTRWPVGPSLPVRTWRRWAAFWDTPTRRPLTDTVTWPLTRLRHRGDGTRGHGGSIGAGEGRSEQVEGEPCHVENENRIPPHMSWFPDPSPSPPATTAFDHSPLTRTRRRRSSALQSNVR